MILRFFFAFSLIRADSFIFLTWDLRKRTRRTENAARFMKVGGDETVRKVVRELQIF